MKAIINNQSLYNPQYPQSYNSLMPCQEHVTEEIELVTKDTFEKDIKGQIRKILIDDISVNNNLKVLHQNI